MNITWQIDSLIVNPQIGSSVDVVVAANWRVWAEENGVRGTVHGRVNFPPPQPDSGDKFTKYADLTEGTILQWVWEIGRRDDPDFGWSKQIAEQQAIIALRSLQAAVTERPLPWVPPTPPQPERATLEQRTEALELLVDYLLEGPTA